MRRLWIFGVLAYLVLGVAAAAVAEAGDASRLYVAGRRAVLDERWNEAVLYLTAAIERQSREGGEVVVYGKHLEPYLPHFLLGVAFYELGALDAAATAWQESESQGRQGEVQARLHKTLAELLQEYGSSLASTRAFEQAQGELAELRHWLEGDEEPWASALEEKRSALRVDIEMASSDLGDLRHAAASKPGFESARALEFLARVQGFVGRHEELRHLEMEARRRAAAAHLRTAECQESTIDEVLDLLRRGAEEASFKGALGPAMSNMVQELVDRCGLAQDLLLAVARRPSLFDPLTRALGSGPGRDVERPSVPDTASLAPSSPGDVSTEAAEGLGGWKLPGDGTCDRLEMARAARWVEARAFERAEIEGLSAPLAETFEACGEPEIAAAYLNGSAVENAGRRHGGGAEDRSQGIVSPGTSPELSSTSGLAEAWAEATLRIDAGICDPGWRRHLGSGEAWPADSLDQVGELSGVPWTPDLYGAKAARNCGQREGVGEFLGVALRDQTGVSGRRAEILQSLTGWYREQAASDFYSGRHALIFAATDYGDGARGWPDLPGAGRDAEAVRDALLAYGFDEPLLVTDPSGRAVRREMKRFIEKYSDEDGENRLLLIYWAGHGAVLEGEYGDETWSTGFLVPVDAPYPHEALDPDSSFTKRAVSMDSLNRWAREMPSRHAIFMLDSCYSGSAFQAFGRAEATPRLRRLRQSAVAGDSWDPLARYRQPVRLIVASSAADQRAADQSQFRRSFVEWLERPSLADFRRDQIVSGNELCLHLGESTREASGGRQSPSCQCLASPWDRGDVIFPASHMPEQGLAAARWVQMHLLADLATWQSLRDGGPEAWTEYLRHYPQGRFAELARRRLFGGAGALGF